MIFRRQFPATRRSKRQWLNTSVRVFTERGPMDALGINLSEGGMGLFAVTNLPVGSRIQLEFLLPQSEEPVRVEGQVRHRALYLYGIEFVSQASGIEHFHSDRATPYDRASY